MVWLELAVQIALMIWMLVTAIQKQNAGVAVVTLGSFLFMISDISILFLYFYKNKSRKVHLFNLTTYYVGIFLLAVSPLLCP